MSWKNNAVLKTSVKSLKHVTLSKFLKYERKLFLKTSGMSTAAQEKIEESSPNGLYLPFLINN